MDKVVANIFIFKNLPLFQIVILLDYNTIHFDFKLFVII